MATTSQNTNTQHTIITQPLTMSANSTSLPESRKRSADAQGTPSLVNERNEYVNK